MFNRTRFRGRGIRHESSKRRNVPTPRSRVLAALAFGLIGAGSASAVNHGVIKALPMDATVVGSDLELRWTARSDVSSYKISRVDPGGVAGPSWTLPGSVSSLVVTDLQVGAVYEWRMVATLTSGKKANGVLRGGIDVELIEDRGRALLCVAEAMSDPLAVEIERLVEDLVGDGWRPSVVEVPAVQTPQGLKATIVGEHGVAPLAAVILLGNLPVPYSGSIAPDAHSNHRGAWPADVYYADVDGDWTDEWRVSTGASWSRNHNTIGDGKFDQSSLPSDAELMVGRIDLSDLPAFAPKTETDLLRSYLDRDHAFRHGAMPVPRTALIDDHLSHFTEGISANARAGFASALGRGAVSNGDWPDEVGGAKYLMGSGFGYASWTSLSGVGSTASFAATNPSVVFSLFFGSYFGDWDNSNNLLRASIAGEGATLASGYNGRPQWQFHGLGLGAPLGAIARESQNAASSNPYYTSYYSKQIHVALQGDPTLRLFPRNPATSVAAVRDGAGAIISWQPAPASPDLIGYHLYRAAEMGQTFARLNAAPIVGSSFQDVTAPAGGALYQVRALYREVTGSGSFINNAQAAFVALPELPIVEVVPAAMSAREGGSPAVFVVKRFGDKSSPLVVELDYGGTATAADDFPGATTQLSFPEGEAEVWVAISAIPDSQAEGAEELIVSVAPVQPASYVAGPAVVCITVFDDGYGVFAEQWFGHEAPDPMIGGVTADLDGDGLPNLIEYVTGGSPLEYSAAPLESRGSTVVDGVPYRVYAAPYVPTASSVVLGLETSTDLETWSEPAGVIATPRTVDSGSFEMEFLVPESGVGGRGFVRLVAEQL